MLISSERYSADDLRAWKQYARMDLLRDVRARADASVAAIESFKRMGRCYISVSWGKDSVVIASLASDLGLPYVWVRVEGVENPDCLLVRDAFLDSHDVDYHEIEVPLAKRGGLTSGEGFHRAALKFGKRYITGIRAQESSDRKRRMKTFGISSKNTCAPIGWWNIDDVFAYLAQHKLPIHPAYACLAGGTLKREDVRVAAIGGMRGRGMGRAEWERRYYPEVASELSRNGY